MLKKRGLCTRQGAKFQSINIRRLIWHVGYTGYIITKAAKSEYMPQLQIIDDDLFAKANERMDSHYKNAAENKNAARKSDNPCLLAGIIVCAHCGAKMSAATSWRTVPSRRMCRQSTTATSAASTCGLAMGRRCT